MPEKFLASSIVVGLFASQATWANNLKHIEGQFTVFDSFKEVQIFAWPKNQSDFLSQPLGTEVKDTFTGDSASRVWL